MYAIFVWFLPNFVEILEIDLYHLHKIILLKNSKNNPNLNMQIRQ